CSPRLDCWEGAIQTSEKSQSGENSPHSKYPKPASHRRTPKRGNHAMNDSSRCHLSPAVFFLGALFLTAVVLSLGNGNASGEDEAQKTARAAIRKVLEEQVAAWNKGDLEAFMTGYWNSADLTFSSGKQTI